MEPKKLSDKDLNTVSGGHKYFDDNYCNQSPTKEHEWEELDISPYVTAKQCKCCGRKLVKHLYSYRDW